MNLPSAPKNCTDYWGSYYRVKIPMFFHGKFLYFFRENSKICTVFEKKAQQNGTKIDGQPLAMCNWKHKIASILFSCALLNS